MILALGMLVDNAIVVCDGILIRVERGESRTEAAEEIVRDTRWPLLGATFVAILAFAAIGFAPGDTGEFCRSLFQVMALSLLISWVLAVTVTPLFCVWFLKIPEEHQDDPYDRPMFRNYRRFLNSCIHHRWLTRACHGHTDGYCAVRISIHSQIFLSGLHQPALHGEHMAAAGYTH